MLVALILVPLAAGFAAWIVARSSPVAARWIAVGAMAVDLGLVLALWIGSGAAEGGGEWMAYAAWEWIPRLGIGLRLGVDGLSLVLVALTAVLGLLSVACSWSEITERVGFFHFNLMWILAGVIGVFLALDLMLFYFFWELMLVPMAFLIGIWGHENRIYAAIKFFLFTQASGLLMLVAIVGLWAAHGAATGTYTFDYLELLGTPVGGGTATWLMLGFFVAFAVKLPVVPFHTWLPDAHTEAPTAGSVVLAGLLLKTGGYGLIRYAVPLFPDAARDFAPTALALGAVGVLYGAWVAFAQTDLKRLVAYTSVSHLGFVLLGVYAWNELALQGAVLQMVCHGLSTGALFILVGQLQERTHSREMGRFGGLWNRVPRMAGLGLFFALASLGLPGLGNFVAEFLTLVGAYRASIGWTAAAAVGLVLATVYSLRIVQRVFHGEERERWDIADLGVREVATLGVAVVGLLWLGLYPQPVIDVARPALERAMGSVDEVGIVEVGSAGRAGRVLWAGMSDEAAVAVVRGPGPGAGSRAPDFGTLRSPARAPATDHPALQPREVGAGVEHPRDRATARRRPPRVSGSGNCLETRPGLVGRLGAVPAGVSPIDRPTRPSGREGAPSPPSGRGEGRGEEGDWWTAGLVPARHPLTDRSGR